MVYQRIDMVIRQVLRWILTGFVGALFPPPAPKLAWSFRRLWAKSSNGL